MELNTLEQLFVHDLRDLWSAESQVARELERMCEAAHGEELRDAIVAYRAVVRRHVEVLEKEFRRRGERPQGKECRAIAALLEADRRLVNREAEPAVMDAAIVGAISRMQHYKIAADRCLLVLAAALDEPLEPALHLLLGDEMEAAATLLHLGAEIGRMAPRSES
jgi:ferritin-like metal-binding protein YciE